MGIIRRYPVITFFALAYLFSWYDWLRWLLRGTGQAGLNPLGPAIAALIVSAIVGWGDLRALLRRLIEWRVGAGWYGFVFLLPVAVCLVAVSCMIAWGAPIPSAATLAGWREIPPRFVFIFLFIGLGEEPGWRGFALPRLLARYGEFRANVILAALWALWHIPLTFTELKPEYVPPFLVSIFSATFVITWMFNRTKGSVLLPMLLHSSVNVVGGGYFFHMFSGSDLIRLWWLYAGLWLLVAAAVVWRSRATATFTASEPGVA